MKRWMWLFLFCAGCLFDCGDDENNLVNNGNNQNNLNNTNNTNNTNNGNNLNNGVDAGSDSGTDTGSGELFPENAVEVTTQEYDCTYGPARLVTLDPLEPHQITSDTRFGIAVAFEAPRAGFSNVLGYSTIVAGELNLSVGLVQETPDDSRLTAVRHATYTGSFNEIRSVITEQTVVGQPDGTWAVTAVTDLDPVRCVFPEVGAPTCAINQVTKDVYDSFGLLTVKSAVLSLILQNTANNGYGLDLADLANIELFLGFEGVTALGDLVPGAGRFNADLSTSSAVPISDGLWPIYPESHKFAMRPSLGVTRRSNRLPFLNMYASEDGQSFRPMVIGFDEPSGEMTIYSSLLLDEWYVPPGFEPQNSLFSFTETADMRTNGLLSVDPDLSNVAFGYLSKIDEGVLFSTADGRFAKWTGDTGFTEIRSPQNFQPGANDPMFFATTGDEIRLYRWNMTTNAIDFTNDLGSDRLALIQELQGDIFALGSGLLSFKAKDRAQPGDALAIGLIAFPFNLLAPAMSNSGFPPTLCTPR